MFDHVILMTCPQCLESVAYEVSMTMQTPGQQVTLNQREMILTCLHRVNVLLG